MFSHVVKKDKKDEVDSEEAWSSEQAGGSEQVGESCDMATSATSMMSENGEVVVVGFIGFLAAISV